MSLKPKTQWAFLNGHAQHTRPHTLEDIEQAQNKIFQYIQQTEGEEEPTFGIMTQGNNAPECLRSEQGASLALACMQQYLSQTLSKYNHQLPVDFTDKLLVDFTKQWQQSIIQDFNDNPLDTEELALYRQHCHIEEASALLSARELPLHIYDTSLSVFVMLADSLYLFCLGTGQILLINQAHKVICLTDNAANQHSRTYHLAGRDIRHLSGVLSLKLEKTPIEFLLLASAGYVSSFKDQTSLYKAAYDYSRIVDIEGAHFVAEQLDTWLQETIQHGSGQESAVVLVKRLRHWYDGLAHAISQEVHRIDSNLTHQARAIQGLQSAFSQKTLATLQAAPTKGTVQPQASAVSTELHEQVKQLQGTIRQQKILLSLMAVVILGILLMNIFRFQQPPVFNLNTASTAQFNLQAHTQTP